MCSPMRRDTFSALLSLGIVNFSASSSVSVSSSKRHSFLLFFRGWEEDLSVPLLWTLSEVAGTAAAVGAGV